LANIPVNLPNLNDGYNYVNITYDSLTSPFLNGVLRGYKRGETYRFGIVFYNKKGEASFAEYIGDIKFPDLSEPDGIDNATGSPYWLISEETNRVDGAGVTTTAYALGIEFTLDFSSCPSVLDKIESYQIVRVKRNIEDKRRLCSGILKNFYEPKNIGDENSRGWDLKAPDGSQKVLHLYTYSPGKGSNANFDNLHDVPGESPGSNPTNFGHEWHAVIPLQGNYLTFHSPELSYEFDNEKALGSISPGSALLLMTGAYAQYYSDFPNSNFPVSGQPDKQLDAASTTWVDRYSLLRENTVNFASDDVLLGWNMDWKRKQRTTVPVLKDTPARSKEYVKLIKNSEKTTFRGPNSTGYDNDGASIVAERANNTFKFENRWLRNFYAGNPEGSVSAPWDLNDPGGASNWGSSIEYSEFSKGASGLVLLISPLKIDPLENTPIALASQSQAPGFYIGDRYHQTDVTPWEDQEPLGVHPIPPTPGYLMWNDDNNAYEEIEAPNMFDYNQLRLSSRPLLDVVIPKQEIYGGFGEDALASNTFIPASPIIDKDLIVGNTHTFRVYGGDIFLSMWTIQEGTIYLQGERLGDADGAFYEYGATNQNYSVNNTITNCIVIESEINCGVDHGSTLAREVQFDVIGGPSGITDVRFRQENNNSISQYGTEDSTGKYNMYINAYNEAYSREKDDLFFLTKPSNFDLDCNKNDIRAYISNVKINEELLDSWTQFGANNNRDVDDYGPINKIVNFRDEVYFFQDKAVGAYSINPRAIVSTEDGIPTELGSGEGFQDHQYITNEHGSIHQWAVKKTDTGIYYYDAIHNKIFRISQGNEPLSELTGIHSFLNNFVGDIYLRKEDGGDNPILNKGAHITRDKINDEVLFTFLGTWQALPLEGNTTYFPGDIIQTSGGTYYEFVEEYTTTGIKEEDDLIVEILPYTQIPVTLPASQWTIVFDELAQKFSSFYSGKPPIYLENGNILLSPDPLNRKAIYIHNKGNYGEFYDSLEDTSISLVINHKTDINKVLRFIEFNSIVRDNNKNIDREQTITGFRIHNEYQDTGIVPFSSGRIKRRFDKWRLKIPRDSNNQRARLRSTHFVLTLYFDNTYNKELILNRIVSHFDLQTY
jgi:hypothetical protein